MRPIIRWAWRWGPAVAMMAAIFYASGLPDLTALPGGMSDKVGHLAGYGLLGVLLLRGFAAARLAQVAGVTAWRAFAASVAYGVSDEAHQWFVRGRTAALDDLVADALGAAVAIGLCWLVARVWRAHAAGTREV